MTAALRFETQSNRRSFFRAFTVALAVLGGAYTAQAQAEEASASRTLNIIVPYPAGGSADTIARMVGERLGVELDQPVVVLNRPGGSSAVGLNAINAAPADGRTLFFAASTLTTQAAINKVFTEALDSQLVPLTEVVRGPFLIASNPQLNVSTITELIDYSKKNPDDINYGSTGIGSSVHFTVEAFKSATGAKMTHVPYPGSAPVLAAILGNHIQVMTDPVFLIKPHVEQGKLRALAVTGAERSQLLPDVPTVAESGYPDFDLAFWMGFFVRSGTSESNLSTLNSALTKAINDPSMHQRLSNMGFEPIGNDRKEFQQRIAAERDVWLKVARENNLGDQ